LLEAPSVAERTPLNRDAVGVGQSDLSAFDIPAGFHQVSTTRAANGQSIAACSGAAEHGTAEHVNKALED